MGIRSLLLLSTLALLGNTLQAEPPAAASKAFDQYAATVESRLAADLAVGKSAAFDAERPRLKSGEFLLLDQTPAHLAHPDGALFRHWHGAVFVPGANAHQFLTLMRNLRNYPQLFAGSVTRATIDAEQGNHYQFTMRSVSKFVLTVTMDTSYAIDFVERTPLTGISYSRSTNIREIENVGTPKEHALAPEKDHGFLWRLNTYWTWREADGGLYLSIDTLSLSRDVPLGIGWAVGPFVEKVPRQSIDFTLKSVQSALTKKSNSTP